MTTNTPLRSEVSATVTNLRQIASRLEAEAQAAAETARAHADQIEEQQRSLESTMDQERIELLADAQATIARAKKNGSAWKIWERITAEWEAGFYDKRGGTGDFLRDHVARFERLPGVARGRFDVSVDANDLDEALSVVDAWPDASWENMGQSAGRKTDHWFQAKVRAKTDGYFMDHSVTVNMYFPSEHVDAVVERINSRFVRADVAEDTFENVPTA